MTWHVGQLIRSYLSRDANKLDNHPAKDDISEQYIIDVYEMVLRRGLTPRDALTVAAALDHASREKLPKPNFAERSGQARPKH
ncbi:MAG: hypothetical protein WAN43_19575 [Rhodomicrobium sp.]